MPMADDPSHSQVHEIIRLRSLRGVGLYQGRVKSGCDPGSYLLALHPALYVWPVYDRVTEKENVTVRLSDCSGEFAGPLEPLPGLPEQYTIRYGRPNAGSKSYSLVLPANSPPCKQCEAADEKNKRRRFGNSTRDEGYGGKR